MNIHAAASLNRRINMVSGVTGPASEYTQTNSWADPDHQIFSNSRASNQVFSEPANTSLTTVYSKARAAAAMQPAVATLKGFRSGGSRCDREGIPDSSRSERNALMLNSLWFIVPIILIVAIVILFMAFITWLTHTLDGYPMSLIQNGDRGPGVIPHSDPAGRRIAYRIFPSGGRRTSEGRRDDRGPFTESSPERQ